MITREALDEAIAACNGERDPNAQTCIKLAAYYIIKDELYPADGAEQAPSYSFAPAQGARISIDSGSEFAAMANGLDPDKVMPIMDDLMDAVSISNAALYRAVLRKLATIQT